MRFKLLDFDSNTFLTLPLSLERWSNFQRWRPLGFQSINCIAYVFSVASKQWVHTHPEHIGKTRSDNRILPFLGLWLSVRFTWSELDNHMHKQIYIVNFISPFLLRTLLLRTVGSTAPMKSPSEWSAMGRQEPNNQDYAPRLRRSTSVAPKQENCKFHTKNKDLTWSQKVAQVGRSNRLRRQLTWSWISGLAKLIMRLPINNKIWKHMKLSQYSPTTCCW